jgi:hypothetical protein
MNVGREQIRCGNISASGNISGEAMRLRRIALRHTQFAEATCGTIRLNLFKIGAMVRVSVRRVKIAMASVCPYQNEFALAHLRLTATAH